MVSKNKWIVAILALLVVVSCRRDDRVWQVNVVAPIFQADLSLKNIVADSLLSTNGDNSYNLVYVYRNTIDSMGQILQVPDTVNESRVSLQKLVLGDETLIDTVKLVEIAPETRLLDGKTVVLPAQDIKGAGGETEIDVSENFFKSATITKGFLDIDLHNDLPVEVETLIFKLSNKNDGMLIALDTFKNILPFTSASKSIDISGKEIDGILIGEMIQVKTKESSGPVLVDADKGVRIELRVRDVEVEKAIAVFPQQTLVKDTSEVKYNLGKAKITEMSIKTGNVAMTVISTIEEAIVINYTVPNSGRDGDFSDPINITFQVPPAKPGQKQEYTEIVPIDGYAIRYKGKDPLSPPFYNTIYSELTASTVYSGIERNLSLSDSVIVKFGLVDIVPGHAIGEFGDRKYDVVDSLKIDALKDLQGAISLEDATLEFIISNGFGIEADFTLNSIKSVNTRSKKILPLDFFIIGSTELIKRANNPPFIPFTNRWEMNNSTSNIKPFLENLPNIISYDISLESQPNGSRDFQDFIFDFSKFETELTLNLPVNFGLDSLGLTKLADFDFTDIKNNERIKSGLFKLKVENDYPIDAYIELEFLDANKQILYEAFKGQKVTAASLIPGQDLTDGSELTYLEAEVDEVNMEHVRNSKYIRIKTIFDTPDSKNHKVYDHYQLKTKLLADFIYEQAL